jgi:hypothetical protein
MGGSTLLRDSAPLVRPSCNPGLARVRPQGRERDTCGGSASTGSCAARTDRHGPTARAGATACRGSPVPSQLAGIALDRPSWRETAVPVLRRVPARPWDEWDMIDAGLCHGWAGMSHITRLMASDSDAADLSEAADGLARRVIGCFDPDAPVRLPVRHGSRTGRSDGAGKPDVRTSRRRLTAAPCISPSEVLDRPIGREALDLVRSLRGVSSAKEGTPAGSGRLRNLWIEVELIHCKSLRRLIRSTHHDQ